MDGIRLEHIYKSYTTLSTDVMLDHAERPATTRTVLKDLSLTIPAGRITVIVGRSGCGKSTLLKLLSGKETMDSGRLTLPEGWHTALLSPEPYVITWTSVLRNVELAVGAGFTQEQRREVAEKLVKLVKLNDFADLTPVELSTGMRQRLGLARVLASQAELLLMDEPFAALDFITRAELQTELLNIQNEMRRTIVLVTHQLEEALLLAQRIVVMHADSAVKEFDLSALSYPRDLASDTMQALKAAVTEECKK
ncbi:MAG: ABC transporter ATP-binding protein [Oscillospiraceae bacterium]|nr:ABC transporter ATP-binding protein [Oscillospiraceae bacterium]